MSVYYMIHEHLILRDAQEELYLNRKLAFRICIMGAMLLSKTLNYCKMSMIADGKQYCFTKKCPDKDLQDMVLALYDAEQVDFSVAYDYSPDTLSEVLQSVLISDDLKKRESIPDSIFYSAYYDVDCSDEIGSVYAMGFKDGKHYNGWVEPEALSELPDHGTWENPNEALIYDPDDMEGLDKAKIDAVCRELCTLSESCAPTYKDGLISLYLTNLSLKGRADLEKYIALAQELMRLTNGDCWTADQYVNYDGPDVEILELEIPSEGAPVIRLAAV